MYFSAALNVWSPLTRLYYNNANNTQLILPFKPVMHEYGHSLNVMFTIYHSQEIDGEAVSIIQYRSFQVMG